MAITISDENELSTIANALIVAAQRFEEDAQVCRDAGHERVAAQFDRQAAHARELHTRFEEA